MNLPSGALPSSSVVSVDFTSNLHARFHQALQTLRIGTISRLSKDLVGVETALQRPEHLCQTTATICVGERVSVATTCRAFGRRRRR